MVAQQKHLDGSAQQIEHMRQVFVGQQAAFSANPMFSAEHRITLLKTLRKMIVQEKSALVDAIRDDFGNRSADETLVAEILPSLHNIDYTVKRLRRWMKPSRRSVGMLFQPASARVVYQPLGVVGVIVPWNYPLFLTIGPLVSALAAGNRVMLKLSEATPVTSQLLKTLLGQLFPEELIAVSLGSAEVGVAFSQLPFDHLLFTGATSVGRYVMRAAAENLTPVTLELGGKSPAIISSTVPMAQAAERIAFGKAMNAGQTCVAPDYVLVPRSRLDDFTTAYREAIQHLFPKLEDNPDYTSIINDRQLQRLAAYILDAQQKGAQIIPLFPALQGRRLPHTLILNPRDDMDVMREEIFGPLLPVVTYDRIEEALRYVTERPRPLALYYFGHDRKEQERVLYQTHSGGVCLNDTLLHVAQDDLPFGGVGQSGMGHYHGHEGFLTFSHAKSVFSKGNINSARLIYPPYGKTIQKIIYWLYLR